MTKTENNKRTTTLHDERHGTKEERHG